MASGNPNYLLHDDIGEIAGAQHTVNLQVQQSGCRTSPCSKHYGLAVSLQRRFHLLPSGHLTLVRYLMPRFVLSSSFHVPHSCKPRMIEDIPKFIIIIVIITISQLDVLAHCSHSGSY